MTGDVLLQSVPCYVCSMIEIEEGMPYSHSGVVVKSDNETSVLESWNNVQKVALSDHLKLRRTRTLTLVLRPLDANGQFLSIKSDQLLAVFNQHFAGHHYDDAFLWNNSDESGETFYCSEMTAKLLNYFFATPLLTKPMHFTHYRQDWIHYFKGTPPDGQAGVSPADLARSPKFKVMGTL